MRAELTPHPDSPASPVTAVHASVRRIGDDLLLSYEAVGALDRLRLPPPAEGWADALWRHTCFEAFVADAEGDGYTEVNVAPSSQWAVYRFTGYRQGMTPAEAPAPDVRVAIGPQRLDVAVRLSGLSGGARLGLSAVIEDAEGRCSYWALRHRPGPPDFHHPETFVLALPEEGA